MYDLSPLPDDATEAQRTQRLNLLSEICLPLSAAKGQNGVTLHVAQGNLIAEINTKELAEIVEDIIAESGANAAGPATGPTIWRDKTIIEKVETLKTLLCEATIEAICNPDATITVTLDFGPTVDLATLCAPPEEE